MKARRTGGRPKRIKWIDPNKVRAGDRKAKRYCRICGNPASKFRILAGLNLCEFCVADLEKRRDGVWSCKACGKVAPDQLKEHNGYCEDCVCPGCGRPDPENVRKYGMCRTCYETVGAIYCVRCGKEAPSQVKKNRGFCDACAREEGEQR